MFVESLDKLPEDLRGDFVESEFNGVKGFQHKDTVALANSLKNAKAERDQYRTKATEYESQMSEAEKRAQERIEEAKRKALEDARSKGDVEAIEKRYQEQMADLEKRTEDRTRKEVEKEFKGKEAAQRQKSLARELGLKYGVDNHSADTISELLERRIQVDAETGKEIYLDENGGATSLDRAGFEKEFFSSPRVIRLVKADVATYGGGMANGNNGAGGASSGGNFGGSRSEREVAIARKFNLNR